MTLLMVVGLSVNAEAAGNPISLAIFGGMATPTGDFADYGNSGISFGGSIIHQTNELVAVEFVGASGQRFGVDAIEGMDSPSVNIYSLTGGIRVGTSEADIFPYAAMGAGYYRISFMDFSENAFGLNFGGGIQTRVAPTMSFFGEMRYHIALTEGTSTKYLPIHAGMRFNW
jgi:hypothetical protein